MIVCNVPYLLFFLLKFYTLVKNICSYLRCGNETQPVLVTNGVKDVMVPTENSYILTENLPNAQLIIYPNSGHGHLFQYSEQFAKHVNLFLDSK